jgi:hypothetical protein
MRTEEEGVSGCVNSAGAAEVPETKFSNDINRPFTRKSVHYV